MGNVEFKLGVVSLLSLRRKLCDLMVVTLEPDLMLFLMASLILFTASRCSAAVLDRNKYNINIREEQTLEGSSARQKRIQ